MASMALLSKFKFVGMRFSNVHIDDAPIANTYPDRLEDEFSARVDIQRIDPTLSLAKLGERPVIELGVSIAIDILWDDDSADSSAKVDRVVDIRVVCGIVGEDEKYDGDLESVKLVQPELTRMAYLSVREHVDRLLENTWVSFPMPIDLTFVAEPPPKSPRKSVKKIAAAAKKATSKR